MCLVQKVQPKTAYGTAVVDPNLIFLKQSNTQNSKCTLKYKISLPISLKIKYF